MSTTRVQLALNVTDLDEAVGFYRRLFATEPSKVHEGYANFAVEDPPLKLVLIENREAGERLNHLGVEAPTAEGVSEALSRFQAAGLETTVAEKDVCCHASQDKVFVAAPDVPHGWWEYYSVIEDVPSNPDGESSSVCAVKCAADDTATSTCCG